MRLTLAALDGGGSPPVVATLTAAPFSRRCTVDQETRTTCRGFGAIDDGRIVEEGALILVRPDAVAELEWDLVASCTDLCPVRVRPDRAPSLVGPGQVGTRLVVDRGTWTNGDGQTAHRVEWFIDDRPADIGNRELFLEPRHLGKSIRVEVTADRGMALPNTVSTDTVVVGRGAAPRPTRLPSIDGIARPGRRLTADPGRWFPQATHHTYRWSVGDRVVRTGRFLRVRRWMQGETLTLVVSARTDGYRTGRARVERPVPAPR